MGESILGRESLDVIFCFHFLSFCIHFLSFAFMSFHVPSLCIKDTGLRKLICSNRSGGYPPKRSRFLNMLLSFLLSFSYRFGSLCRLPSSGFMNVFPCLHSARLFFLPASFKGSLVRGHISTLQQRSAAKTSVSFQVWIATLD